VRDEVAQVKFDYAVAMPTIPPRRELRQAALNSVWCQDLPATAVSVAMDVNREGAWLTRQRALDAVRTTWTFFLDDDDLFKPQHTAHLLQCAVDTDADYVFSYYDTSVSLDVLRLFGHEFNPDEPTHTTMIVGVKTDLAQEVGFTAPDEGATVGGEDWRFTLGCVKAGAHIVHLPEMTWIWRHHIPGNTSGLPTGW
jgi:hypothetical protein